MKFAIVSALFFAAYATAASIQAPAKESDKIPGTKFAKGEGEGDVAVKKFIPKNTSYKCSEDPNDCIQVDGGTSQTLKCGTNGMKESLDEYVIRDYYRTKDCSDKVVQTNFYPRCKEGMCVATGEESNIERFFKIDGDKISIGATDCENTIEYTKDKCDKLSIVRWN